jgi:hypothetical protein
MGFKRIVVGANSKGEGNQTKIIQFENLGHLTFQIQSLLLNWEKCLILLKENTKITLLGIGLKMELVVLTKVFDLKK